MKTLFCRFREQEKCDSRIENGLVVIGVAVGFMVAAVEFMGIAI